MRSRQQSLSSSHNPNHPSSSNRFQELNLNDLELENIPSRYIDECPGYYSPTTVKRLSIARNRCLQITGLPAFQNLVSLDVSNNGLPALPEDIGLMSHLKTLIVRNNLIEQLPKSMTTLATMENINLSGNRITIFPEVILSMPKLKVLHLGGNMLESLPYNIGTLEHLEILYLGGNRLEEIPATIGLLSKLSSLSLCDNVLQTIPSTLGTLEYLESLALHNNSLKTLPTEIIQLKNLQQLSLRNNPLVHQFIHNMELEPPKLKELAGRVVKTKMSKLPLKKILPIELVAYLRSASQCVNPKCQGVYFEACVEHVKFVDFCGKYRVPLLQFLCSPKCSASATDHHHSDFSSEDEEPQNDLKMKKVLLG